MPATTASGTATGTTTPSTSKTPQPSPAQSSVAADPAAASALKACQGKVAAADGVLAAAKTGVTHWAAHVQAQTDRSNGKISVGNMKGRFAKTRSAGPEDQRRYSSALANYRNTKIPCDPVKGAAPAVATRLDQCLARSKAQQPLMKAGASGMADWQHHLASMKRSSKEYVPNAKKIWLDAWRAAPKNINAYRQAVDNFDAPSC